MLGDDCVELGREQVRIAADQVEELLVDGPCDAVADGGCGWHGRPLSAQALMAWRSSPLLVMEILRGLACSATGITSVSTPAS